ncbi:MAG: CPBP family intramembrane metalloprotease [Lactobacillaceae bacterium]|jgi:hypothetical protein|nr:CPBP family intramembrane metalloprotease [Lactobacillaceae bacterium]
MKTKIASVVKYLTALVIPLALVFIPIFGRNSAGTESGLSTWPATLRVLAITISLFFVALFYWSDGVLKKDWGAWKQHWGRNILIALGSTVFMYIVLVPISKMASQFLAAGSTLPVQAYMSINFWQTSLPTLLVMLVPLLQAFTEEMIYHHALIAPFAGKKSLYIVMSIFANLVFALAHFNNVNGSLPNLVLYFVMGVFFQLMFFLSKRNIWQNVMTHLLYNSVITFIGAFGLIVGSLMH